MHGNCKSRPVKIGDAVAVFATIRVSSLGELPGVDVLVAIHAGRKFDVVQSVFAGRYMALVARDRHMLSLERIVRGRVLLHAELGGLPAGDGMAFRAFALTGPSLELALVRIGGMAIRTLCESQRALKVASCVTPAAVHLQVHPKKRIFRFRMVELAGQADFVPTARGVAGLARALEGALVRVGVAGDAGIELDSCVLNGVIRS